MSALPDLAVVSVAYEADGATRARLSDGTVVEARPPSELKVILPTEATAQAWTSMQATVAARRDKEQRREQAIRMKRENPDRSVASIAREMNLSPSSLRRWLAAA